MNSDNLTRELPGDKLDRLIIMAENLSGQVASLEVRLTSVEEKVDGLGIRLTSVEDRLTSVERKVDVIDGRLSSLENTVDDRLKETRPIWESVLARLEGVEIYLDKVVAIAHDVRFEFRDWRRTMNPRIENLESRLP